jgi:L-glyceraldehyde 3-phosphate reductase
MLTSKYLDGIPADSRAAQGKSLSPDLLTEDNQRHIRELAELAEGRNQTLAQLAIAWVLRRATVTSALVGASSVAQLEDSVRAVGNLSFTDDELAAIDEHARDGGLNLWAGPSSI